MNTSCEGEALIQDSSKIIGHGLQLLSEAMLGWKVHVDVACLELLLDVHT